MTYIFIHLVNYSLFIIVMFMSRNIVSCYICMFYVLCNIVIIIKLNKFMYFSYSDIIISVYGIMCINNTINKL